MKTITRTIYGAAQQTAKYYGIPYYPDANTTLNEKFGILQNTTPLEDAEYKTQWLTIGLGGHELITGADGIPLTRPKPHDGADASNFKPMPFVLRPLANDISADQRQNYSLRREETHNDETYVAYYAKKIDVSELTVKLYNVEVDDQNNTTKTDFVATTDNLNPTPTDIYDSEGEIIVDGEYYQASAILNYTFDSFDAAEYREAARIIYGDESYAIISEMGFIGAVETTIEINVGGDVFNFDEIIGAQIVGFLAVDYSLYNQNTGFEFTTDMGIVEPRFAVVSDTSI